MKPRSKGEYNNIKRLHPRGCGDELILDKLIAIKNYYSTEYNYNYSRPDLQTFLMLNRILFKPILFHFCKFKYFKDLASEIGYPIFKIN